MICKFDATKGIDAYVDTDFAGGWFNFNSHELGSTLSRTDYIIKFTNGIVCWVSKLQTEVALSTTEAEYISLSQSTRNLLPIRNTLELLNKFI